MPSKRSRRVLSAQDIYSKRTVRQVQVMGRNTTKLDLVIHVIYICIWMKTEVFHRILNHEHVTTHELCQEGGSTNDPRLQTDHRPNQNIAYAAMDVPVNGESLHFPSPITNGNQWIIQMRTDDNKWQKICPRIAGRMVLLWGRPRCQGYRLDATTRFLGNCG